MASITTVALATAKRNIIADLKYKFDFLVQATWSLTNVLAFAFLGFAVGQGDSKYAPAYSMSLFFVISTAFWTLFSSPYEETTLVLREEAQRGTMGFLVTNDVNPFSILLARFISASFKFFIVFLFAIVPVLYFIRGPFGTLLPHSMSELSLLALLLFNVYLFMFAMSALIGSLSMLFKNTQTIAKITHYALRILSTYFTPLAAFAMFIPGSPKFFFFLPVTMGLEGARQILILHSTSPPPGFFPYYVYFIVGFTLNIVLLVLSKKIVNRITHIALKAGTLEFY